MWRHAVQTRGASTGRFCAQQQRMNRLGAATATAVTSRHLENIPRQHQIRALSSAQPFSWDEEDSSPFAMSSAPSLQQIPNPTAERVVMKSFLNTLQLNSVDLADIDIEAPKTTDGEEEDSVEKESVQVSQEWGIQVVQEQLSTSLVAVSSVVSVPRESDEGATSKPSSDAVNGAQPPAADVPFQPKRNESHQRLLRAIKHGNAKEAKIAYLECLHQRLHIKREHLMKLFNGFCLHDPITAMSVLKEYRKVVKEPAPIAFYAKLCNSIGNIDWQVAKTGQFTKLCHTIRDELVGMEDDGYRRKCFPILLVSLLEQPMPRIGKMARGLYGYMAKNDYPLSYGTMSHILGLSRYTRQDDLSFSTILSRIVKEGYRPTPHRAIHVLQNTFPYTNIDETILVMKEIIHLQSSWEPGAPHPNYKVDIGILEHIMAAAARKGSFELNILVWDLVDMLGYEPTEFMYENTIQGFAMGVRQDHNMFAVLNEMEERGFSPSRALIRSLSRSVRFSRARVDHGHKLLQSSTEGVGVTLASLNVVLSAAGEQGDVDRAFAIFEDFDLYEIEPNSDSFSFLLESLAKNLTPKSDEYKERMADAPARLDAASAILSLMEEQGIPRCHHCIEQYTQLLCNVDRLDAANEFLLDSLERGDPVNNRIIINVSKNNAFAGNIEVARLFAAKTSEPFGHLGSRINQIEKELMQAAAAAEKQERESADEQSNKE